MGNTEKVFVIEPWMSETPEKAERLERFIKRAKDQGFVIKDNRNKRGKTPKGSGARRV